MLSGHVTYACPCLNIKIHLSSKYDLNKHASERQQYWFQQETPAIEGWLLELGMGAVVVAYSSLIETRTSSTSPWMTVGCLNCNTNNVYSIHNKASARNSSSLTPNQANESIVIHKDTLFGHQIDDTRKDHQFSDIFDIKLSDTGNSSLSVNQNEVPEQLKAQHQELYQVLEKALEKMRLASEVRIEQWKKVEMERLEKDSKKAKEESDRLWKKVLAMNQHDGTASGVASQATTPSVSEKPPSQSITPSTTETPPPARIKESPPLKGSSQKPSSHGIRFMDNGNESALLGSYRRSSFSLNENVIANSANEQAPDSDLLRDANEQDPSSDEEDMFDLDEELSSFEDTADPQQHQQEDTDVIEPASVGSSAQSIEIKSKLGSSQYGSSWIRKKRLTGKYIEDFKTGLDDLVSKKDDDKNEDDLSRSISAFATSMPININSPFMVSPDNDANNRPINNKEDNTSKIKHPSKPNTISYTFAPTQTSSSTSFVGYDFSFSDRALSKQFPDFNPERRRSVSTVSGRRHPQLDALIEKSSLDTRSMKK